jgi:hypothetical protein
MTIALPIHLAIDAQVDLCLNDGACLVWARLGVSLPDMARDVAQALADAAHETFPHLNGQRQHRRCHDQTDLRRIPRQLELFVSFGSIILDALYLAYPCHTRASTMALGRCHRRTPYPLLTPRTLPIELEKYQ